jgi:hypothetical protein
MRIIVALSLILMLLTAGIFLSPSNDARSTGISNVQNGCICHGANPTTSVNISMDGIPDRFAAGMTYTFDISFAGGPEPTGTNQGGFNLHLSAGTLALVNVTTTQLMDGEVTHTSAGNDQRAWQVNWTAPDSDEGVVDIRLHVNSVNGDQSNSDEDKWNTLKLELKGVGWTEPKAEEQTPGFPFLLTLLALIGSTLWFSRHRRL